MEHTLKISSEVLNNPFKAKNMLGDNLKDSHVKAGDVLSVAVPNGEDLLPKDVLMLFIVLGAVLIEYFKKQSERDKSQDILNNIFSKYNSAEELEKAIEEEYNIQIKIKNNTDKPNDFSRFIDKVHFGNADQINKDLNELRGGWNRDI